MQNESHKKWAKEIEVVEIPSSDGSKQPSMWYCPATKVKKPLLVGLHTWSNHYATGNSDFIYGDWCIQQDWAFLHPDFRGRNGRPETMGSDRVVEDVVEAVEWGKKQTNIDLERIYLIGVSGGGHLSMIMAGRHPEIWAGVSAWCGIYDIAQWHREHTIDGKPDHYALNIESALGGDPNQDQECFHKALHRSPRKWLSNATSVPLDIQAGIHDGRTGSVPFYHSLQSFNAVVQEPDRLNEKEIETFYRTQKLPHGWPAADPDPHYGKKHPIFQKHSRKTRITIFNGGHDIVQQVGLNWLAQQRKDQPAVWTIKDFIKIDPQGKSSASGL